jgi:endonuclease-8
MAEGHSSARWARMISRLVGAPLVRAEIARVDPARASTLTGASITRVQPRGKHLLVFFSNNLTLHTHALMSGKWHVTGPAGPTPEMLAEADVRLVTSQREALFTNGPVIELLTPEELAGHARLNALGPDVLDPLFDRDAGFARLRRVGAREIGDALLDQTLVCGVGNKFKIEALFVARLDPRKPVGLMSESETRRMWDALLPMMRSIASASSGFTTLPRDMAVNGERHWVYARTGKPCFVCGATVISFCHGRPPRITFACQECQK